MIVNLENHRIKNKRDAVFENLLASASKLDASKDYELLKAFCALLGKMDENKLKSKLQELL
jgi:hypothetical protein